MLSKSRRLWAAVLRSTRGKQTSLFFLPACHRTTCKSQMAAARFPPTVLSLKQFLQRQQALGIYRNMLRTIQQVPDEGDRKYLRDWARDEFKRNKSATDQDAIRMMITQAKHHLEEMQKSLSLARS